MKLQTLMIVALAMWNFPLPPALAQFDSGSDGSDGALTVTNDLTLDLPPSGIFQFTTINVMSNTTLRFNPNALNTSVHLLASGDVVIAGIVNVSGQDGTISPPLGGLGGPGGFKGGDGGITSASIPPGAGQGPGGGRGQTASISIGRAGGGGYAVPGQAGASTNNGLAYGTPLVIPLIGGSGGGGRDADPGFGGGGGGGGLLIASNGRIEVSGQIRSLGGIGQFNQGNDGSGGAIRLVASEVAGNGIMDVTSNFGGHGRIRIDALDRGAMNFTFNPASAVTVGVTMLSIPSPLPRLDIIEAAGTAIAEGSANPVSVILPIGSNPNRTVVVQARDFNGVVPVRLVLTPEHGTPFVRDGLIDNMTANPAQATFNVTFMTNAPTAVHVFTR